MSHLCLREKPEKPEEKPTTLSATNKSAALQLVLQKKSGIFQLQYRETKHSWECFLRGLPRGFQHGIGLKLPIWDQSLFCSSVRHRHPSCCPRPQQPLVSKLTGWHLAEAAKRRFNLSQVVLQGCSPRSEVEILVELVHLLVAHVLRPPCRAAMYFPSETQFSF